MLSISDSKYEATYSLPADLLWLSVFVRQRGVGLPNSPSKLHIAYPLHVQTTPSSHSYWLLDTYISRVQMLVAYTHLGTP